MTDKRTAAGAGSFLLSAGSQQLTCQPGIDGMTRKVGSRPPSAVPVGVRMKRESMPWWERAACLGMSTDMWFPTSTFGPDREESREACVVCSRCPVRGPCLRYAFTRPENHGIWGGWTASRRDGWRTRYGELLPTAASADA